MRTTIELKPENRAKLLAIAAHRGEKGFSSVVNDAIEQYVPLDEKRREDTLMRFAGILTDEEAEEMKNRVKKLRKEWR